MSTRRYFQGAAAWRYDGTEQRGPDKTVQDGVPTLQQVLDRVLAGQSTGLGNSGVYDESDTDDYYSDRLDLELERQDLLRRRSLKPDGAAGDVKTSLDVGDEVKEPAAESGAKEEQTNK